MKLKRIITFCTIFIVLVALTGCEKSPIAKLKKKEIGNEVIKCTFEGFSSEGTYNVELDDEVIKKIVADKLDYKEPEGDNGSLEEFSENLNTYKEFFMECDSVKGCFKYDFEERSDLKNDDKLTIKVSVDSDKLKSLGYKYVGDNEINITVKGLKEFETIDAFSGLSLEFKGMSPGISVERELVSNSYGINNSSYYMIDKMEHLKNGETVTATITESCIRFLHDNGYIPESETKKYIASGNEYIESYKEYTEEELNKFTEGAVKSVAEYFSSGFPFISVSDLKCEGGYFSYNPNSTRVSGIQYTYRYNRLVIVCSAHLTNADMGINNKLYYALVYDDLARTADKKVIMPSSFVNKDNVWDGGQLNNGFSKWYNNAIWKYRGYSSLQRLKDDILRDFYAQGKVDTFGGVE